MADSRPITHNEGNKDTVNFTVFPRYDPGQAILCEYDVNPQYTVQGRDYVALYAAEDYNPSKTLSNYLTWQWADIRSTCDHRTINFPARHLPQASSAFLLFAYVSRTNGVIGSSNTFQIIHSCGDPVSISSYTTDKSSFVVLEKSPSDFSTPTRSLIQSCFPSSHQSENGILFQSNEGKTDNNSSTQEAVEGEAEEVTERAIDRIQTSKDNTSTVIQTGQVTTNDNNDTEGTLEMVSAVASPNAHSENKTGAVLEITNFTTETQEESTLTS